jgi:hypothetical protein
MVLGHKYDENKKKMFIFYTKKSFQSNNMLTWMVLGHKYGGEGRERGRERGGGERERNLMKMFIFKTKEVFPHEITKGL